jgi:c-di-GMP-binding flagellar brake protein YcgR
MADDTAKTCNVEATTVSFDSMSLQVGARLQLQLGRGGKEASYFTALIGYVPHEFLLVKTPVANGVSVPLCEGEELLIRTFTGVGIYSFTCFVDRVFFGPLWYAHLTFPETIQYRSLRRTVRVDVDIPAQLKSPKVNDQLTTIPGTIKNLSVNGALIQTHKKLGETSERIELSFEFLAQPGNYQVQIATPATIRAVSLQSPLPEQARAYAHGVEFNNLDPNQQIMLQNLVYGILLEKRPKPS